MRKPSSKEVLTEDEVGALLEECSPSTSTGLRNRALITVLYRGGLRISEALSFRPRDMDSRNRSVSVSHRAGGVRRLAALDTETFEAVSAWLERRRELGLGADGPVLSTLQGEPIKTPYVRALLPRLAERAGVRKRVHALGLRDSGAAAAFAHAGTHEGHAETSVDPAPEPRPQLQASRPWSPEED